MQFVAGSLGDTLDHLTGQDLVGFTGSASTAATLRAHPGVVRNGVRFSAEADSLNLLGARAPTPRPGTPEFDLYVGQLVTEMTVKAGQKCTAIRRAFVPAEHVDAVVEAVSAKLARRSPSATRATARMGALAGLEQREEVRRGIKALTDAGRIVYGDPEKVDLVDADAERGAFLSPILLVGDPERAEPHEVEAFGPVSTVLPYTSTEQLVEYAARGQGSLAGSVVTADPAFAREVVLGVAPWHGRLLVLNGKDAKESTGHGSPMPQLVHGGPGRAGGGEELGGLRGVLHHMQRTAVQADPDTLTAITGRWVAGSARTETDVHPFRKHLEELSIGDTVVAGPRAVTQEDVEHFAEFTGDTFYAHMDAEAAAEEPDLRRARGPRLPHAGVRGGPVRRPRSRARCSRTTASTGCATSRPVRFGDEITVTLTCKQITPHGSQPYGDVRWDADVTRQDGESVARYDVLTLVAEGGRRRSERPLRGGPGARDARRRGADVGRRAACAAARRGCGRRCTAPTRTCRTTVGRSTRRACTPTTAATSPTWPSSPPPSKADLRENYPFGMFAVPQEQVRRIHASSGTTGQPTVVGYTARDIDNWAGLMARSLRAAGGPAGPQGAQRLRLRPVHRRAGRALRHRAARAPRPSRSPAA